MDVILENIDSHISLQLASFSTMDANIIYKLLYVSNTNYQDNKVKIFY